MSWVIRSRYRKRNQGTEKERESPEVTQPSPTGAGRVSSREWRVPPPADAHTKLNRLFVGQQPIWIVQRWGTLTVGSEAPTLRSSVKPEQAGAPEWWSGGLCPPSGLRPLQPCVAVAVAGKVYRLQILFYSRKEQIWWKECGL